MYDTKIFITTLLILFFHGVFVYGQNFSGSIRGYISSDGSPVAYANVGIEGTSLGAVSNDRGYFTIENVPLSTVQLQVSCIGYEPAKQKVDFKSNDTVSLSIVLQPTVVSMKEVVITGQYEPTEIKNSVYRVKVLGSQTMQQRGTVNLSDVLMQEANIRIVHDNVLGSNIIMQGLSGQNVKVLMDGVPLISGKGDMLDLEQINLNNIERVEVIEGPLSVQYGTNALAGTINLIEKSLPEGKRIATGINTYYESVGQYNADVFIGTTVKKNKLRGAFGRNQFTGYSSQGAKRSMNWNPSEKYFATLKYTRRIGKLNLGVGHNYFKEFSKGLGEPTTTASYSIATDRYHDTKRLNANLFLNGKINNRSYVDVVAGYQQYRQQSTKYLVNLADESKKKTDDPTDHNTNRFDSWVFRGAYSRKYPNKNLTLQGGYDLNWNQSKGGRINKPEKNLFDGGLFLSINYKLAENFELQPAFRYVISSQSSVKDIRFLSSKLPITPSLVMKYTWRGNTLVRASYAKGFRTPSLRELYFYFHDANHSIDGNPKLTPETAHNLILSVRHSIHKKNWTLRIEPSAYYNHMINRIYLLNKGTVAIGDENKVNKTYTNLPFFRTQGIELRCSYLWKDRLIIKSGVGLMARSGSKSASKNFYSYEINSSISYTVPKWNAKFTSFYKYNGPIAEFSLVENRIVDRTLQGYSMMDISASKAFKNDLLALTIGAKNLFNITDVEQTGNGKDGLLPRAGFKQQVPIARGTTFFVSLKVNFYK